MELLPKISFLLYHSSLSFFLETKFTLVYNILLFSFLFYLWLTSPFRAVLLQFPFIWFYSIPNNFFRNQDLFTWSSPYIIHLKVFSTNPHYETVFRLFFRFSRPENLTLLIIFKSVDFCLKFIKCPPTTEKWQITPPLEATIHGIPPFAPFPILYILTPSFAPSLPSLPKNVEYYLLRRARKRPLKLVVYPRLEIELPEVLGELRKRRQWCRWVLRGVYGFRARLQGRRRDEHRLESEDGEKGARGPSEKKERAELVTLEDGEHITWNSYI